MTERQAITAVATAGVCVCQQARKLYPKAKQDIYPALKEVEDALAKLGKVAGTRLKLEQVEALSDRFGTFFKTLQEV